MLAVAILIVAGAAGWRWSERRVAGPDFPPLPARGSGPLTVVATGDTLLVTPLSGSQVRDLSPLVAVLGAADATLTNLEVNLLEPEHVPDQPGGRPARGPYGTAAVAAHLRQVGVNAVSLANNHAGDYGSDGIRDTRRILDRVGLHHAGSGEALTQARQPVFVGQSPRRIAMIAVSTSSEPEARATKARGEIMGRPGLSPLRYIAEVTADPMTFATLKASASSLNSPQPLDGENALSLFGTTITKGPKTAVQFTSDAEDVREILDRITRARAEADAVIVSLHSHEPSNFSDAPAQFVRRFAHDAIDAGAALVVGHGPHRLRGVEVHGQGAVLYSVGNFIFQAGALDSAGADVFDAGVDLYQLAIGAVDPARLRVAPTFEEPEWWEGVIARATFANGALTSLQLQPVDLGADLPRSERGIPRVAAPHRAARIFERLSRLGAPFGPHLSVADGIATVDVKPRGR